jgi:glutathione-independent formaldehyde dehydrogenase
VLNGLLAVVRAGGGMGIPGIYTSNDPEASTEEAKQGRLGIDFGKAWIKSPQRQDTWLPHRAL